MSVWRGRCDRMRNESWCARCVDWRWPTFWDCCGGVFHTHDVCVGITSTRIGVIFEWVLVMNGREDGVTDLELFDKKRHGRLEIAKFGDFFCGHRFGDSWRGILAKRSYSRCLGLHVGVWSNVHSIYSDSSGTPRVDKWNNLLEQTLSSQDSWADLKMDTWMF